MRNGEQEIQSVFYINTWWAGGTWVAFWTGTRSLTSDSGSDIFFHLLNIQLEDLLARAIQTKATVASSVSSKDEKLIHMAQKMECLQGLHAVRPNISPERIKGGKKRVQRRHYLAIIKGRLLVKKI